MVDISSAGSHVGNKILGVSTARTDTVSGVSFRHNSLRISTDAVGRTPPSIDSI